MIRFFDFIFSLFGLIFGFPILFSLYLIGLFDTGSPLFKQERVGKNQRPFTLVKFRTMKKETRDVATHLVDSNLVTRFGLFLRKTKLDELPQLWNVLKGEMSLVGPRPCLFNQKELIHEREKRGVLKVRPGVTGISQLKGIDMSQPKKLSVSDAQMIEDFSLGLYFKLIFMTALGKGSGDRIKK